MDDDYDNYVPQISTMDWQNLGGGGGGGVGQDGTGHGGGGQGGAGPGGNAFLYETGATMGQSGAGGGGQFQQQRTFPGMGMQGGQQQGAAFPGAEYGGVGGGMAAGGVQGTYQPGGAFMQAQMAAQQQQMQRQMMGGMPPPQGLGQYGAIGSQGSYSMGPMMPPPPAASSGAKSAGAKSGGKGSKKSKKAQAAEAAAAAQQQAEQQGQMMGGASGSGQQQQFPMASGQMGGFYYKTGPGPSQQQQMMAGQQAMMMSSAGAQQSGQMVPGKWPSQYQQTQVDEQQRQQQFVGQQQMQGAQSQQQQHYGPLQHLQSQYGSQAQQHLPQQSHQQQAYPGYPQPQQSNAAKSAAQLQESQQSQQQTQQKQQQPQGQYNMSQTAAYYGQQQYPQQQSQQQQTGGPGPTGQYMGMPQQQQTPQAGPANYQIGGGYPPSYSAAAMQQKQAYYAQQQMMATGAAGQNAAGGMPGAAGYYQQQPPYGMPNPYMIQQQQIYREMCECDQQLGQAIAQAQSQQSPELAMRIEKLQMHRQYLQHAAHTAAAAAAAAANAGTPMQMGMATPGSRDPSQQPQSTPQSAPVQYQPYPSAQQPQGQQGPGSVPVQQKMAPPNAQPPPPYGPPQYAPPSVPGVGFHSPTGPQSVPPSQHQQPPTPQQVVQQPQQQQQIMAPQYAPPPPPHMSSPSVAVMSASNQVQVNIRPAEMPGRTMISVYHSPDIPSTSIQPAAVVSSATMPYQMPPGAIQMGGAGDQNGQNLAAKDSIPPEPLPPNLAQEQKRRKQQQQLEQEQQQREKMEQQQIREQQAKQMLIQQQQVQPSHAQIQSPREQQPQFSMEPSLAKQPPSKTKSPPRPQTPPTVNASVSLNFFGPGPSVTAKCSKMFPIIQRESAELSVEEVKEREEEKPVEMELIESSASIKDESGEQAFEEKEHSFIEASPTPQQSIEEEKLELNLREGEEQPSEMNELIDEEEQQRIQRQTSGEKIEPEEEEEGNEGVEEEAKESTIEAEKEEQNEEAEKSETISMVEKLEAAVSSLEAETLTPSTSDAQLEGKADDKESTADDSQWPGTSTKETSPQDAEDFPFAFRSKKGSTSRKSSAPAGGTRSGKQRNKKRKMDWNRRDEDDDYVGSKKKKGRKGGASAGSRKEKAAVEEEAMDVDTPPELLDEDLLVEKRRSSRKSAAGKKAKYGEDSENDEALGEPLPPEEKPSEAPLLEPVEERVVEKILGVRMAKRTIRKEKEEKIEAEENGKNDEMEGEGRKRSNAELEEEEKREGDVKEELVENEEEEKKDEKEEANKEENADSKGGLETNEENESKKIEEEAKEDIKADPEWEEEEIELEELFVKFKGFSYMHCEWKTVEELEEMGDKRVMAKLNRWKQKFGDTIAGVGEEDEQEYFNEDYTVVARVLDETYDEQEEQHYIFVKWKALPYEDCTWELAQDIPEQKMAEYRRRIEFDTCKVKEQPRLSPQQWSSRLAIPKEKLYKNENVLREYQHEGVNWLLWTWTNGRNCILADEMGLGKTVQTIVFFQSLYDIGIHGPFLVVVPLSTLGNWEREFDNWTDINAIVYHGSANSRRIIQDYEFFYKKGASEAARRRNVTKFDALITTYEVVVQEVEVLRRINFRVCVIDEAHRIKNRNCKLLQTGLLSLRMEHRVLLTGTPLQNNIQELFSLLNFLEPEQFANSEAFLQQFGQCQTEEQVQKLQEILKPMMLRRLKEDVEKELQPKEETIIEVQLSNIQKKYYRAVLERNFTHLMKGTTPSLINTMMQLRKCCNHPYLINGAEEQILAELKLAHPELASEEQLQVFGLISSSGKLVLIDKLLPKLHADGHKVLIFSQMVRVLDLLEEYLNIKGYPFERIDGNIRGNERQAAIDRFSKPENKDRFVFLLCTRAGGLGINLTAADTVIIFDSDWNPQNDLQAQARCHRIGQTKPVKIYRLITSNTYEREMFDKASLKLGLDKAVLQSMLHRSGTGDSSQQMSRQEVEDLLRKGAYGAIMDEDNEGTKFSEEDIDTILQRRTQTIRLEPGVKGSTFAKASFTTSHNRDDIDIGDPDFWSKWAKKAQIDVDALNDELSGKHLIVHEPRSRKKRFEENFKGNSESGDEAGGSDDDDRQSTPGASRIAEGVKSRSARKKRRTAGNGGGAEDDEDYAYKPDELAFNKSVYFKVEKLLTQWGWGRWSQLKQSSELSEHDLEHIARTLLLHCVREFKGDEKVRDYVWALISPAGKEEGKEGKGAADSKSKFNQGWAVLPEYNPPFICVDMTFQRHLHRHSNKLLNRVQHLHFLQSQLVKVDGGPDQMEVQLKTELPDPLDGWLIMPQWDRECDRDLLLGVHRHGMENWELIRTDPRLCFTSKAINFPNTLDLNNRFKYLISMLMKRAESGQMASEASASAQTAAAKAAAEVRWSKVEETDFMRILRNYGVKDDTNSENVINWVRFREISIVLRIKSDAEMLEMLYCVLAMCTKQQGGMLSPVDERRADRVEAIAARSAEKLMNRLHLMRKVHAIITMGIQNIRGMLKLVALDVMPKGWSEAHDEHLLIVVDKFGLEDIHGKLKHLPKLFDAIQPLDEHLLLRRVVEICATLENGKWTGPASIDNLEETTGEQAGTSGGQSASVIVGKGSKGGGGGGNGGNGRKKADAQKQKGSISQGNIDKNGGLVSATGKGIGGTSSSASNLAGSGKGGSGSAANSGAAAMSYNEQQMLMKMMEQMSNPQYLLQLMSMMGPATGTSSSSSPSNSNAALQQQFQQLQTLLTLTALSGPDLGMASNLSSLTASLASLAGMTGTGTSQQSTSTGTLPKAASSDVLNLSKKSAASSSAEGKSSSTMIASSSGLGLPKGASSSSAASLLNAATTPTSTLSTTPQQSAANTPIKSAAFSSADACLSTGLSTSAINKLSQMSVPELLAFSNLAPETRIPVVHAEGQQKLDSEKAPTLKSLDQFLRANPKYNVDLLSLATSHPSLFSATGAVGGQMMSTAMNSGSMASGTAKTPTTPVTSKKAAQQQGTPSISGNTTPNATPTLKAEKLGTTTSLSQASSSTSITQQLIEQTKKGSSGSKTATNASFAAGAGLSASLSSLFGLDLQNAASGIGTSTSSSAQQTTAALNQFLAGLTGTAPTSSSQQSNSQLQSSAAALAALAQGSGGSTSSSSNSATNSLKNMEQQLLLLQQAALLGGASSAAFNPYAALLYTNPTDLFGTKTSSSTSSAAAALQSSLLGSQNAANLNAAMADSTMAAAAALAQAATAGFPAASSGSAGTDLTSALTSELYMAAMASTLPTLLGGSGAGTSGSGQSAASALQQQSAAAALQANSAAAAASLYGSMTNAATLDQLLAAAGLAGTSASALSSAGTTTAGVPKGLGGTQTQIKSEQAKNASQPSASPLLSFQQSSTETASTLTPSLGAKKSGGAGSVGGKGLKLNALLEKLASAGAANSASASSSPLVVPAATNQQASTAAVDSNKQGHTALGEIEAKAQKDEGGEQSMKNATKEEKREEEKLVGKEEANESQVQAVVGDEPKEEGQKEVASRKKDGFEEEKEDEGGEGDK